MSDLPRHRMPSVTSGASFMRQRSSTLEGLSVLSATGRRKPIEMSSELKAAKLQVDAESVCTAVKPSEPIHSEAFNVYMTVYLDCEHAQQHRKGTCRT